MATTFAEAFRSARRERRITLRKLGDFLNLSIGYLSDLEHERKDPPKLEIVAKIEQFLNITDGSLLLLANESRKKNQTRYNMVNKLRTDPKLSTILMRAEQLSDEEKDRLIESLNQMEVK